MQFILIAHDRADGLPIRKQTRPDHLAYLTKIAPSIVFGGPLIDDAGVPCGSAIIYEAPDRAAVDALIANDPYTRAGLFAEVEIRTFRTVVRDGTVTA
jgi:uncharacterized protein YciI